MCVCVSATCMCEVVDSGRARRRRPINKRPAGRCVFHTEQGWGHRDGRVLSRLDLQPAADRWTL